MKRRLLAFFMAFAMMLSLVPPAAFAADAGVDPHFTKIVTESGEALTASYVKTVNGEAAWGEKIDTPYYHVTVPEGTEKVLVTYPKDTELVPDESDEEGNALFFYMNTYPGQSEISYGGGLPVSVNEDGSKTVTVPVDVFLVDSEGSGTAVAMAYMVDAENRSALDFIAFAYAAPAPVTHAVTLTAGEGYTLAGEAAVEDGADYTFTLTVAEGYEKTDAFAVKANGEVLTDNGDGSYTATQVYEDLTVTVEGVARKQAAAHTVTLKPGTGYTLAGEATVEDGKDYTFSITTAEGYYKGGAFAVKADGKALTANEDGTYTVSNVTADVEITVEGVVKKPENGLSDLSFAVSGSSSAERFQMTPAFDPAVKEYTVLVPDSATNFYVWATRDEGLSSKGTIKAKWTNLMSSTGAVKDLTIKSGTASGQSMSGAAIAGDKANTITFTVTDGEYSDTYTVTTIRTDPTLKELSLGFVKLNKSFASDRKEYTAKTADESVTVDVVPKGSNYTVTINGGSNNVVNLEMGENVIEIEVRNARGEKNIYTITVTRVTSMMVTLDVTPANAKLTLTDASGTVMTPDGSGAYCLMEGSTYYYTAVASGYMRLTGSFTVTQSGPVKIEMTEDTAKPVTVYFSFSHDDKFEYCDGSGTVMALKKVTVPYFDLANYGMEDFYFKSETYTDDGDGLPGSDLEPGTPEFAYGKITMLHLFIYSTEVYYLGLDPADAGQGYLYDSGLLGSDLFSYTGSVGSIFFNTIWNYDLNLNYYLNHEYPLASEGWGSTADQILLREGDVVTLGHFTDWSFFSDSTSVFNHFEADNDSPNQGDKITLSVIRDGADMYGTYNTAHTPVTYCPDIYCAPVDDISSGDVTTWTHVGKADEKGQLTVDTSDLAPGEYIFAMAGQPGAEYTDAICSTPGGMRITVRERDAQRKGDINGDGVMDVVDVTVLFNAISGEETLDTFVADVNRDGVVDMFDVIALYDSIRGE